MINALLWEGDIISVKVHIKHTNSTGGALQFLNLHVNLGRLGNGINLWLGMQPAEIFFYIFLPPLLLDSAVRIDFFVFKKVSMHPSWKFIS